eukprot:jgi/Botrbrau1/5325/Bobra.0391s0035.1
MAYLKGFAVFMCTIAPTFCRAALRGRMVYESVNLGRRLQQTGFGLESIGNTTCGVVSVLTVGTITCGVNASNGQISTQASFFGPFGLANGTLLNQVGQAAGKLFGYSGTIGSFRSGTPDANTITSTEASAQVGGNLAAISGAAGLAQKRTGFNFTGYDIGLSAQLQPNSSLLGLGFVNNGAIRTFGNFTVPLQVPVTFTSPNILEPLYGKK